ncbi:MAG: DUF1801 domain-containing protein [Ferruginibacter sp.]
MAKTTKPFQAKNIDEYIASFPKDIQEKLLDVRAAIRKAAPKAEEAIKYDMPTFVLNGHLVSFGAWKNHIGFYPAPREVEVFKEELAGYEGAKSTVKFPFDKPLPLALISKMVKFRVQKHLEKAGKKDNKNKSTLS